MAYFLGLLALVAIYLVVKSLLTQRSEGSVSQVLEVDFQKKKNNSDKKVQEFKDAKDTFSSKYNDYLTSKRDGDGNES